MSFSTMGRTSRVTLLRPFLSSSELGERRCRLPKPADLSRELAKSSNQTKTTRKADTISTDTSGGCQSALGSAIGGINGEDGGEGDGDSDGPRRRLHSTLTPSCTTRRTPSPPTAAERRYRAALLALVFLTVFDVAMAYVFANSGFLFLAGEVIAILGGLPKLARALLRPK